MLQHFLRGVEHARNVAGIGEPRDVNSLRKAVDPSLMLVLPVIIIGIIVCCFLSLAFAAYWRGNARKRLINGARELNVASKTIPEYNSQQSAFGSIIGNCGLSDTSKVFSTNTETTTDVSICSENLDWLTPGYRRTDPSPDITKKIEWIKNKFLKKSRSFNGLLSFNSVLEQNSIPIEVPVGAIVAGKPFQMHLLIH